MINCKTLILDNDPYVDPFGSALMRFRLTYSGPLLSSGNEVKNKKSDHKHALRLAFHPQLKRLWETHSSLNGGGWNELLWTSGEGKAIPQVDWMERAKEFQIRPWNFVPLITHDMEFYCGIEVLFLTIQGVTPVIHQGDLDGRLKTLIDALCVPDPQQGYSDRRHEKWQNPLYVLLQDDNQITKVSVETDQLLEPVSNERPSVFDVNDAKLLITVHLAPVVPAQWSVKFL